MVVARGWGRCRQALLAVHRRESIPACEPGDTFVRRCARAGRAQCGRMAACIGRGAAGRRFGPRYAELVAGDRRTAPSARGYALDAEHFATGSGGNGLAASAPVQGVTRAPDPIALANFEEKVTRSRMAAVNGEPLRLSRLLPGPIGRDRLRALVDEHRLRFSDHVAQARRLCDCAKPSARERRQRRGP